MEKGHQHSALSAVALAALVLAIGLALWCSAFPAAFGNINAREVPTHDGKYPVFNTMDVKAGWAMKQLPY